MIFQFNFIKNLYIKLLLLRQFNVNCLADKVKFLFLFHYHEKERQKLHREANLRKIYDVKIFEIIMKHPFLDQVDFCS